MYGEKLQVQSMSLVLSLKVPEEASCLLCYIIFKFYIIYNEALVLSVYNKGTSSQAFCMGTVLSEGDRSCSTRKDTHTSKNRAELLECQFSNTSSSLGRYI